MLFRSAHPDVEYPTDLTIWQWAFDSRDHSPLYNLPPSEIAGYTNAFSKERLDYHQVKEYATYLSTALVKKYGMRPEDTVSVFSPNSIWYPVVMFATLRAGGRLNGASPAYHIEEMSSAMKVAKTKVLFTVPNSLHIAIGSAKNAGMSRDLIFLLEGEQDGFVSMKKLLETGKIYGKEGQIRPWGIPHGKRNGDVCAFLNFSSGTTGLPKAVMLSHQNMIAQAAQLKQITVPGRKKILACLPLFHITGLVRFLCLPVYFNDECFMLPAFTLEAMLNTVVENRIEDLNLVPPIVIRLVRDPLVNKYDLRCVRRISCGSAPISDEIVQLLGRKFPWTGFRQGYGATESCACITAHPPELYGYKYGSTGGTLVASTVAKIVDFDGKEKGLNEIGEIWAKGPQMAMGYLGNEEATKETFDIDGFLHTGDIGSFDKIGLIHVADRIKEMIKVKGQQVAPAEMEDLLLGLSEVEDCAVLGIPDDYAGERPKAYVVPKPGITPDEALGKRLIKYSQEKKVRYKWITEIEFINAVPRNPSGKILRRVLRDKERSGGPQGLVVKEHRDRAML